MNRYYDFLDRRINDVLGADLEFDNLLGAEPYRFEPDVTNGFFERYALIKKFQEITLSLFDASLNGEADPEIASLIINELPDHQGWEYHKALKQKPHHTPMFFRTDEVIPGKISEIQCPGSLWGICEQLWQLSRESGFGKSNRFPMGLAQGFADALMRHSDKAPIIHHLTDNASLPHDNRFFVQQTRGHGLKYFGYDKGITPADCDLVRAHAFAGILSDNHARRRLAEYRTGRLRYDLPPSIVFDEKMSLIFPFWHKTRQYYDDGIRDMFPHTQLITPEGFELEDGTWIEIEDFSKLSQKRRNYYIKYAGSDLSLNWGSKGVYFASTFSGTKCEKLFHDISNDYGAKRYWIIQKGYLTNEIARYVTRDDEIAETTAHSKFSGFYGPGGLLGILIMQRAFYKVHGSTDTIVRLCE